MELTSPRLIMPNCRANSSASADTGFPFSESGANVTAHSLVYEEGSAEELSAAIPPSSGAAMIAPKFKARVTAWPSCTFAPTVPNLRPGACKPSNDARLRTQRTPHGPLYS